MTPLRIGIDARELLGAPTGVGRYLGELLRRWTTRADADAPRSSCSTRPSRLPLTLAAARTSRDRSAAAAAPGGSRRRSARGQARPARRVLRAGLHRAARRCACRSAVTIHDISFSRAPRVVPPREGHAAAAADARPRRGAPASSSRLGVLAARDRRAATGCRSIASRSFRPGVAGAIVRTPAPVREPLVLYRRLDLQPPAAAGPDRRLRRATRDHAVDARLVIVGDDRTWPPQDLRGGGRRARRRASGSTLRELRDRRRARRRSTRARRCSRSCPSTKGSA